MKRIMFLFASGFLSILSSPDLALEKRLKRQSILLEREKKILDLLIRMNTFGITMSVLFQRVEGEDIASANKRMGGLVALAGQSIKEFSLELKEIQKLNMSL